VITEHAICALPNDHPGWRHYALKIQRRSNTDAWVINWGGEYGWFQSLDDDEPEWVMHPGSASQFTEAEALEVAERLAPQLSIRPGVTAADLLNGSSR
jgi:hypothetical protein